jgi:hypothetical protein
MNNPTDPWRRRKFLSGAALAGAAGIIGRFLKDLNKELKG